MNAGRVVRAVWPPLAFGVGFLVLWEAAVEVFDLKPYFLAAPSAIWEQFTSNFGLIWDATLLSGSNALVGLVVGTLVGVAMSFLLMRFNVLNEALTPLAVALNSIPIFVLVSALYNMFALTSEVPRRLMVT
ncbi:MAG: ABC transporter permease, partial [Ilumatobacteraceae bacterium]